MDDGPPVGFSERDVQALTRIQTRLAVTCKMTIKEQLARNVLSAYLGPGAGRQVLNGRIKRGDGEQIHAVIWFSDLRKSTELAESMPLDAFLGVLNDFFEAVAGSVLDHGGEVLRFIGDAALAIFPITDIPQDCDPPSCPCTPGACEQALAAARDAVARMKALNARREDSGQDALGFGIALHVGDVMFGNIGTPGRVEFSVTGPAANMAARIESMCKTLGRPLVVFRCLCRHPPRALGVGWTASAQGNTRCAPEISLSLGPRRLVRLPGLGKTVRFLHDRRLSPATAPCRARTRG